MSYLYIETAAALESLCEDLRQSDWLTLDTEFIRERTYYPELCLIQIANDHIIACIDPLALDNLEPLLDLLYDTNIVKVLHAARQDLEIFYNLRGALPTPIFDTQIGATVLGYGDQIGYGNLVQKMLGKQLDKAHSRTDWTIRPLSPDQLDYAADDVRYLRDVYKQQREQLQAKGRDEWLEEDFMRLTDTRLYQPDGDSVWQKIKGVQHLKKGNQRWLARALADWRENQARQRNKPRKWILSDELLLETARLMPTSNDQLKRIRGMDDKRIQQIGSYLIQQAKSARDTSEDEWPELEHRVRLKPEQEAILEILMGIVKHQSMQHNVSPASLTGRRELEQLIAGQADIDILHGWRGELCGHLLQDLLNGKQQIMIDKGQLIITNVQ